MKKLLVFMGIISVLFLAVSCEGIFNKPEVKAASPGSRLTLEEQIALMHLETEYIKSADEQKALVQEWLETMPEESGYRQLVITRQEPFSQTYERGFIAKDGTPKASEIGFNVFILEDPKAPEGKQPGFAVVCEDIRIGGNSVIAVVETGDWNNPDSRFLEVYKANLADYIQTTIDTFNSVTAADIQTAQAKAARNAGRGSMWFYDEYDWGNPANLNPGSTKFPNNFINTIWGRGAPYNSVINYVNPAGLSSPAIYQTGPDLTALAQLVMFHKWTWNGIPWNLGPWRNNRPDAQIKSFTSRGNVYYNVDRFWAPDNNNNLKEYIFADMEYRWPLMKADVDATYISNEAKAEVAALFFDLGCKMDKYFTDTGDSLAAIEYVWNALYQMGYSAYGIQEGSDIFWSYFGIRRSIDAQRPVYACAADSDSYYYVTYTAWLIDNYRVTGTGAIQVRCNTGEGGLNGSSTPGSNDGWYNISPFNVKGFTYSLKYLTGVYPAAKLGYYGE